MATPSNLPALCGAALLPGYCVWALANPLTGMRRGIRRAEVGPLGGPLLVRTRQASRDAHLDPAEASSAWAVAIYKHSSHLKLSKPNYPGYGRQN